MCRSYYQRVEGILELMFKYLGIDYNEEDRSRNPSNHYKMLVQKLRRRGNPLFLIIGRGEEYQFLCDSKRFRNRQGQYASKPTTADISHLTQFCEGEVLLRVEAALGIAVDCIKIDAECRHKGTELLGTRRLEALPSEVLAKMLYFHDCRRMSIQAGQKSRINELEATVNNMLTDERDLRAENVRLLEGQHRAEQEAETATNELNTERALRVQAEASRVKAVRQAQRHLRTEYARQHDEWYHDLRNYRTDREQFGAAFEDSVEAPARASGDDPSWLDLRRETNELCTDLDNAGAAQASLETDLRRVTHERNQALRQRDHALDSLDHALHERDHARHMYDHMLRERNHALLERDNLHSQIRQAQAYHGPPPYYRIEVVRHLGIRILLPLNGSLPPNMGDYHQTDQPQLQGSPTFHDPRPATPAQRGVDYHQSDQPQLQGSPTFHDPRPATPARRSAQPNMGRDPRARRRA